jgi:arsenite methyltransferase
MSNDTTSTESLTEEINADEQRSIVRERYSDIAADTSNCCDESEASNCCGETDAPDEQTQQLYSEEEISDVAPGADLGLGCGNPTAIASLAAGETVLDLGSGGGFDCFLAAQEVGAEGRVIGVDMTPEMIEKARTNVTKNEATNVEFRLGEIEHLPVADGSVDVIISNCVVNLSPDKPQVFSDAHRVLRPGGRLAISDVVLTAELPADVRRDPESLSACVAGASRISELESMLRNAGFVEISITPKEESESFIREWDDERDLSEYLVSASIEARKPEQRVPRE